MQNDQPTPHWSSGWAFVFVAAGLAIGLGNLWRFPFLAGQYGGGAFVLVYVLAIAVFGLPIFMAELIIGRRGGGNPGFAVRKLSEEANAGPYWRIIGWLCVLIPFVGIAYYSVVAGWVTDYLANFVLSGGLDGDAADHQARFDEMLSSPGRLIAGHSVFMAGVVFVVAQGVSGGLERMAKFLMPMLFILIIGLAAYASMTGAFIEAAKFLFYPDFSKLTGEGVVAAAGQAFFSIGIGLGAIMTFGAYLPKNVSILRVAAGVAAADTAIALLAGLAIFPITFALGIDPAAGPGLIFVSMPAAFASMPAGYLIGSLFFVLLFVAAFTTGVGTIEPVVAWLERKGLRRVPAAAASGAGAWAVGIAAALSFNMLADVRPLGFLPALADKSIFDTLDFTIATVLLPVNGLLAALFAGWAMKKAATMAELGISAPVYLSWRFFVRFLAPVGILAILLAS